MSKIIKMWLLASIFCAILQFPALSYAQDASTNASQPHFGGQAPGEIQQILRKIHGSVSAVDAKTMTLTIKTSDGSIILKVTPKTKFTHGDKTINLKNVTVGEAVEATINVHSQPNEALMVKVTDQ